MRITYFSDYQLLGQAGKWLLPRPTADLWATQDQAQTYQDELMRHQAIYEELLASPEWAGQAAPPSRAPRQRALSARDLTRDLVGWSPPPASTRLAATS